mgnify:CR=1 FL=1
MAERTHTVEHDGNSYKIATKAQEKALKDLAISASTLAEVLNEPIEVVSRWGSKGDIPRAARGLYPLVPVLHELLGTLKVRARFTPRNADIAERLHNDKARIDRARAEKAEIEVAQLKGSLVDAGEVRQAWCDMVIDMRSRLEGIPAKAALLLSGEDAPDEIERKLKGLVRDALVDLAATEVDQIAEDELASA